MEIATIEKMKAFSSEKMKKTNLFNTDRMFCDLYCLQAEQFQKPHAHQAQDKVYYVLEGEGAFRIDNETEIVQKGSAVLAPAGSVHGVKNRSTEPLLLLVFMAPKPEHA